MKILRIVSSGFEEGGVENGIVLLQPMLKELGHEVKILSSDSHPELKHFNDYTYKKPRGLLGKFGYTWNFDAARTLKKVLDEFKPDLVHLHTVGHASPSILFALKGTPTVATIHGPEGYTKSLLHWCLPPSDFKGGTYEFTDLTLTGRLRYWYYRYLNYPIYKRGLKNIGTFVTLSHYMHKLMREEGIESEYVPNGTTLLDLKPITPEGSTSRHTLLYAGRLEKFKGVSYLLAAMPAIVRAYPDVQLYIVGDGRERGELLAQSHSLGIEHHVSFLGHRSRGELSTFYEKASIVLLPSIWPEAFGKTGIEAMSVGRPVIASDVGGISDWLHDSENGFLVPPKKSDALAQAVIKLFADRELYQKFSQNARKTAEQFDLSVHLQKMLALYDKIPHL